MNLEQLLQAGIHCSDLEVVDIHFTALGITDLVSMLHLKSALITLANLCDFESSVRSTYKIHAEPFSVIKPLRKNLEFAKYLRNKFVGHVHPDLISKAAEWQPMLSYIIQSQNDPNAMVIANLWLLETAINTYVAADGKHKIFSSETDLMYPPDWQRFLDFVEVSIRGGIKYLKLLHALWAQEVLSIYPNSFDLELAVKAGRIEFQFLSRNET